MKTGAASSTAKRGRAWVIGLLFTACSAGPLPLGRLDGTSATAPLPEAGTDGGDVGATPDADDVCEPPVPARHYAFDGEGAEVVDLQGGPSAHAFGGAVQDGTGTLHLDGVDDYVALPKDLLAGMSEASVAVWVRQLGGPAGYKRIFDFGTGSRGADPPLDASTAGVSYLATTIHTGNVPSGLAVLMSAGGPPNEIVALSDVILEKEMRFVVVAVSKDTLSLFHEGTLVARIPRSVPLSSIVVDNAWLARSQYSADGFFEADYGDVRIYDRALSDCAVRKLHVQGPNPL